MNDAIHNAAIDQYPARKAATMRFTSGAPRSARVVGDGSRAFFLRSDGPEDQVTSLWLSVIDTNEFDSDHDSGPGQAQVLLADPRKLLADADDEDVPAAERARRERARESGSGIVDYSVDSTGSRVVFTINGTLFLTQIDSDGHASHTRRLADETLAGEAPDAVQDHYHPILNPRISPDGAHVLYTTGQHLILVDIAQGVAQNAAGADFATKDLATVLWGVGEDPQEGQESTWSIGLAEFAAGEEMDRYDGFWWSPDSHHIMFETFDTSAEPLWYISNPADPQSPATARRYPRALTNNADVYLTLAELDFDGHGHYDGIDARRVSWDRKAYEYVAVVNWSHGDDALLLVQNRRQTHDQVLRVDSGTGATTVIEEHANSQWLDLFPGTPAFTPDGRLVCALNDTSADTNRLTVDGKPFTPVGWQVREVLDVTDEDVLAIVQRTPGEDVSLPAPWNDEADEHDARSFDIVSIDYAGNIWPITSKAGQWRASRSGNGMVLYGRSMNDERLTMTHTLRDANEPAVHAEGTVATLVHVPIENHAATPGFTPNTTFVRLGEHHLFTAITRPSAGSSYAHADSLPVLLKPYGGPGFQQVVLNQAYYWDSQWWADQGFIVVTADGRGTTGRGPLWDREIFEDMKRVTLADQVEAVHALAQAVPDADLARVAMIGWSYGGFLSALAVLDAPDVVQAACAGAPPTDWTLYDTHYTERFLGMDPAVYERNSIVQDAPKLTRPLMLIHGFADDNVTIANSLRLSQALTVSGRDHTYVPLTGITHMTNDPKVAENLLTLQRDFLYRALEITPRA